MRYVHLRFESTCVTKIFDYAFTVFIVAILSIIFLLPMARGNNWFSKHGKPYISKEK
jgi:hypothetical protein